MTLRAGLIGFGIAGRYFHAPLLRAAGFPIAAVVSSRAEAVREVLPDAAVVASVDALLARDDVGLVVIASPNHLHAPQATAALLSGRHVVVDKPVCLTAKEALRLAQLADSQNRRLAVFQNRRWDSDFLTLRKLIASGALGDVHSFHARWDRFRPQVLDRWRDRDEPGGGVLFDLGSHLIDQALTLFGKPQWIQAAVLAQRAGAKTDDAFELLMGRGPLLISLGVNTMTADGGPRYRVHGTTGSFLKPGLDPQEERVRAGVDPADAAFGVEPPERWGTLVDGASGQRRTIESEHGHWVAFYAAVRDSIAGNSPVPVSAAEAAVTLEIIEAARRSSATGQRVDLQ
jgi:scyllo-inositol 2-dehydrogenase (NADP+)